MPRRLLLPILCFASAALADGPTLTHLGSTYADQKNTGLKSPEGVTCDETGRVVAADTGNARLVRYDHKDGTFARGTAVPLPAGTYPTRVRLERDGSVLVLDGHGHRLLRVRPDGSATPIELRGIPAADGFTLATFDADASGELYLLDLASSRIVVVNAQGEFQRQLAVPKEVLLTDLAVDARQRLLAIDGVSGLLYASQRAAAPLKALGPSLKAYMNFPSYLRPVASGRIWVVDRNGHGLAVLGPDGSFQGRQLNIGWTEGLLFYPGQLCVTDRGDVFVADRGNHRIQAFGAPR